MLGLFVLDVEPAAEVGWVREQRVVLLAGEVLVPGDFVVEAGAVGAEAAGDDGLVGAAFVDLAVAAA